MNKKIITFIVLSICTFFNKTTVFASSIKEITSKEFYKLQHWNVIDEPVSFFKFQVYYISLSILFVLLIITTFFYFKKKAQNLLISSGVICIILLFLGLFSFYEYSNIEPKTQNISNEIVSQINSKTYLERRSLLKRYENNDYGFKLLNINTNSKLLIPNKKYVLSMQVTFKFPFNFLGTFERFFKYEFTYKPNSGKELKIKYLNERISFVKKILTSNTNFSQFNTICFDESVLDKYNNGKNLEIIGEQNGLFSHYELNYVDLYSNSNQKMYCGKIRYNEKAYIGVDDNKTIYLREVR